ncbi:LysR family transcriptional regulator [Paenibacillus sp. CAA11]|uniref:LysR family transcriptional regulator n=1 Tax=Paenibacillus sp. CAA11 TaxID=1532905 RepID=UPI000D3C9525|nr:LysR family transcriptional regulator [Paenibacillus sp. CAA11]AWB46371.1 LysR family transcriptional regulator [Paenibacillus sp. CAA11]
MDQTLLVFVTAAEKGNFTRAAEELHMTQPAVSQYIRSLEQAVGTKLLDRTSKYVKLNPAGKVVYDHAKQILSLYTRMQSLVDDLLHTAGGPLVIGASYTYGEYVLPRLIGRLQKEYPRIRPFISIGNTQEIAESVLEHRLDIGIVEGEYRDARLKVEPFAEDEMYLMVAADHPLATRERVDFAEVAEENWILREPGSGTREAAERLFGELGSRPKRTMEFGSTQLIKESVEAGLGIALLSSHTVSKELKLGTMRMLRIGDSCVRRPFYWVQRNSDTEPKAVRVFIDMLT